MRLLEWEGKELLREIGVRVPESVLCKNGREAAAAVERFGRVFLKAQVPFGGRGKKGLVRKANPKNAEAVAKELFRETELVLVEKAVEKERELFLSFFVDRGEKCIAAVFSAEGGSEVEESAVHRMVLVEAGKGFGEKEAGKIFRGSGLDGSVLLELKKTAEKLFKAMKEFDLELIEANPLFLTKERKLVAGDAKVEVDENALFRQKGFKERIKGNGMEARAREAGISFVPLNGNIAVIGCGAGLVMATIDLIEANGGRASCFCDVGGGAGRERIRKALEIALENKRVKAVFLNIFGGITRCDEIAEGISGFVKKNKAGIPLVVRMSGTKEKEGKRVLEEACLKAIDSMEEGIMEAIGKAR